MDQKQDFIVIGWGLAGANLIWHLHQRGCKITVYDMGKNHSSRLAAGIVNPIVFKRLTKSWQADTLLPYAFNFYKEIEKKTGEIFYHAEKIARIFASIEEQNNWAALEGDERFDSYIEKIEMLKSEHINAPYGVGKVQAARLEVNRFLDASKKFLGNQGVTFVNHPFGFKQVEHRSQYVFCEGYHLRDNIFFPHIPMKETHGETLTIRSTTLNISDILNKNMFVLPLGDNLYKIGATYNWEMKTAETTEAGKKELLEKFNSITNVPFEIVQHQAGIRPTVSDRRPLLGTHPVKKNLHLFNGLGTKGVMIAPYYAQLMVDYLLKNTPLPAEVDIKRYEKHYNP
ncbi:MAG: FAD-dependent oxidoreductase [Crocinitomicaceae bacterium]